MDRLVFNAGSDDIFQMLCDGGAKPTPFKHSMFDDYEIYHQLLGSVNRKHCLVAADPLRDEDFMNMYDLASLLFDEKAMQLTFVIPERQLSKADQNVLSRALSSIPRAYMGNRLAMVDLTRKATPRYCDALLNANPRQPEGSCGEPALDLFVANQPPVVFSTQKYEYLADEILLLGGTAFHRGSVKRQRIGNSLPPVAGASPVTARKPINAEEQRLLASRFAKRKDLKTDAEKAAKAAEDLVNPTDVTHPLSERYRFESLETDVRGRHVVIVGGTINDAETMDVYRMANAAYDAGALSLTIVCPYFGYSTMERKTQALEAVKAKFRCRLLSSIPRCPMGNEIVLIDLHSEAMPGCFENGLSVVHLYAGKLLVRELDKKGGDWILLSADAGRSKWVQRMGEDCKRGWATAMKVHTEEGTQAVGFTGKVDGKAGKLFDDIGRTMNSAGNAGANYQLAGCTPLDLVLTHLVAPGDSVSRLKPRGVFDNIFVTNSHPRARQLAQEFPGYVHVHSIAQTLVDQLLGRGPLSSTTLA